MNSIPVIGTPIVNGFEWLKRLVDSVDFPVDKFVIINNNGRGELTEQLRKLAETPHKFISKIYLIELPSNLGVAASWNLTIKTNLTAPYWLFASHDIAFTPGLLEEICTEAQDPEIEMIHANAGEFGNGAYDLFLLKDKAVQKLGMFDENCYPAYCEDVDYIMRVTRWNWDNPKNNINRLAGLKNPYYHGHGISTDPEYYNDGAQTKKHSPELNSKLDQINELNFEYMYEKWGPGWRMTNPQVHLFGRHGTPITTTTFNLEFARKKHLGF